MIDLGKNLLKYLVIAAVIFLVVFRVIKPAFNTLLTLPSGTGRFVATPEGEANSEAALTPSTPSYEQSLQTARQIAQQEPKIVASVVKEWVNSNG